MKIDWVERRFLFEKNLKAAWLAIKTEIEEAARTFDRRYGSSQKAEIEVLTKASCVTVTHKTTGRAIQICLDEPGKRLYSRAEDGRETEVLYFGFDEDGHAHIVDENSRVLGLDRISQVFLEPFLFPDSQPAPHVRFPIEHAA